MGLPKKISQLPNAGSLKNSDIFVLVNQHDITSQTTLGDLLMLISGGSSTFTGNTPSTCIENLYVKTISGCTSSGITIPTNVTISGDTKLGGDLNLCPNGTIHCDSFSGCSPIHFHAPVEFDNSITLSADEEVILDFENADDVLIPTYVLKDCSGIKSNIVTFQNFSAYVGQTVNLASEGDTKWEVSLQPTLEVTGVHECCIYNYTLTNCVSGEIYGIVNGDRWGGEEFVGQIITMKQDEEEGCYGVSTTCDGYDIDEKIDVVDQYETCSACTATTYTLFPCDGWEGEPINTDTDLSAYVGGVSSIKDTETGICYTVVECPEDCEPIISINYEPFLEGCESCKDNWHLTNCVNGSSLGTTTTQAGWLPPPAVYTASTVDGCFNADNIKQAATIGEVLDIGSLENCETWPCFNFMLFNCDGEVLGISDQNLTDYDGITWSGSNTTHSFSGECFSIDITEEGPATLGPLDTSDWVEIECGECDPSPPGEESYMWEPYDTGCPDCIGAPTIYSTNLDPESIGEEPYIMYNCCWFSYGGTSPLEGSEYEINGYKVEEAPVEGECNFLWESCTGEGCPEEIVYASTPCNGSMTVPPGGVYDIVIPYLLEEDGETVKEPSTCCWRLVDITGIVTDGLIPEGIEISTNCEECIPGPE